MGVTDSLQTVLIMRARYATKVVVPDVQRHDRNILQSNRHSYDASRKVLVDALRLSKCDFMLKSCSSVPEFAMYLNPSLDTRYYDVEALMPIPEVFKAKSPQLQAPVLSEKSA